MNLAESLMRRTLDIEDAPEDFSATGAFGESLKEETKKRFDPLKKLLDRAQEKQSMGFTGRGALEQAKDTGRLARDVVLGVGKAAGRLATTAVDAGRIGYQAATGGLDNVDAINWDDVTINYKGKAYHPLEWAQSHQRATEKKVEQGMGPAQAAAEGIAGAATDGAIVLGTAKLAQRAKNIGSRNVVQHPSGSLRHEMKPETRTGLLKGYVKEMPRDKIFVDGKRTLLRPEVAQGRLDDYAQVLNSHAPGFGDRLRTMVDANNMHYSGGTIRELDRAAQSLLGDTAAVQATSAFGPLSIVAKKFKPAPSVSRTSQTTRNEQWVGSEWNRQK